MQWLYEMYKCYCSIKYIFSFQNANYYSYLFRTFLFNVLNLLLKERHGIAKLKIYYSVFINKLSLESSGRVNIGGTLASMFGI